MANDQTYSHAGFFKSCLDKKVNIPTGLAIGLLEKRIDQAIEEGKTWVLVRGFPESMDQLHEFEKKVSESNTRKSSYYISGCKNQITRSSEPLR